MDPHDFTKSTTLLLIALILVLFTHTNGSADAIVSRVEGSAAVTPPDDKTPVLLQIGDRIKPGSHPVYFSEYTIGQEVNEQQDEHHCIHKKEPHVNSKPCRVLTKMRGNVFSYQDENEK